jgi:hypothetical protein
VDCKIEFRKGLSEIDHQHDEAWIGPGIPSTYSSGTLGFE